MTNNDTIVCNVIDLVADNESIPYGYKAQTKKTNIETKNILFKTSNKRFRK